MQSFRATLASYDNSYIKSSSRLLHGKANVLTVPEASYDVIEDAQGSADIEEMITPSIFCPELINHMDFLSLDVDGSLKYRQRGYWDIPNVNVYLGEHDKYTVNLRLDLLAIQLVYLPLLMAGEGKLISMEHPWVVIHYNRGRIIVEQLGYYKETLSPSASELFRDILFQIIVGKTPKNELPSAERALIDKLRLPMTH